MSFADTDNSSGPSASSPATIPHSPEHHHQTFPHSAASATRHLITQQTPRTPAGAATSDNYTQAVTAAAVGAPSGRDSSGRPDLDRQQSWKLSDAKRGVTEKVLAGADKKPGYSSTSEARN